MKIGKCLFFRNYFFLLHWLTFLVSFLRQRKYFLSCLLRHFQRQSWQLRKRRVNPSRDLQQGGVRPEFEYRFHHNRGLRKPKCRLHASRASSPALALEVMHQSGLLLKSENYRHNRWKSRTPKCGSPLGPSCDITTQKKMTDVMETKKVKRTRRIPDIIGGQKSLCLQTCQDQLEQLNSLSLSLCNMIKTNQS